jgi:hypothetical protein
MIDLRQVATFRAKDGSAFDGLNPVIRGPGDVRGTTQRLTFDFGDTKRRLAMGSL